jgi:hypothetical protein
MPRFIGFLPVVLLLGRCRLATAQGQIGSRRGPAIGQAVDESKLVTLLGNVHPQANRQNDRGAVDDDLQMDHLLLQLKRPPETELQLRNFLDSQQTDPQIPAALVPGDLATHLQLHPGVGKLHRQGTDHCDARRLGRLQRQ